MSSHSSFETLPLKQLRNAAVAAAPIVFLGEFTSYVVKPLWPYSVYVAPALLLVTSAVLLAWYRLVKRPAAKAYREGKISRKKYLAATSESTLAQWLYFCAFSLLIFATLAAVKLSTWHRQSPTLWHKAVSAVQQHIPAIREQMQRTADQAKSSSAAARSGLGKALTNVTGKVENEMPAIKRGASNILMLVGKQATNLTSHAKGALQARTNIPPGATGVRTQSYSDEAPGDAQSQTNPPQQTGP